MDADTYLDRHRVVYRRDFLAEGYSVAQYRRLATEHGTIRRGVIAHRDAPAELREAARLGGHLTCASAAHLLGLWQHSPPSQLHLAFTSGRRGSTHYLVPHRRYGDRPLRAGPFLPLAEICAHALSCLAPKDSIALVESAVVLHQLNTAEVRAFLGNRHGSMAHTAINQVRGDAGSIIEVNLRLILDRLGLPYQAQVYLPGVGRVDFLIAGFLIVECDGWAFHGNRAQWGRDMDRDSAGLADGYVTLHFRAEQIWRDPSLVQARLLATYARFKYLLRRP